MTQNYHDITGLVKPLDWAVLDTFFGGCGNLLREDIYGVSLTILGIRVCNYQVATAKLGCI